MASTASVYRYSTVRANNHGGQFRPQGEHRGGSVHAGHPAS